MIQRRQTIFMLLTAIFSALLFFMPLASFNVEGVVMRFTVFGLRPQIDTLILSKSTWPLTVLTVLMTVLPLYTIFIYKKRELQVKLCHLNMILNLIFIGVVVLYYNADIKGITESVNVACFYGTALPLANLVLEIFAVRGIKKDIELLRSVDRLR